MPGLWGERSECHIVWDAAGCRKGIGEAGTPALSLTLLLFPPSSQAKAPITELKPLLL